jgi:signal transduction histidine kinase
MLVRITCPSYSSADTSDVADLHTVLTSRRAAGSYDRVMRLRLDPWRDFAVAVVLAFVSVMAGLHIHPDEHRALDALGWSCIAVSCAVLVVRRRWPLPVVALTAAALLTYSVRDYTGGPIYLTGVVALYTYAITLDRWRAAITGAVLATAIFGVRSAVLGELSAMTLLMFAWVALAVLAEDRLRIARDLHDSVAHAITAINVQAGVAAHVLDRDPQQAAPALEAIRTASRDVLTELGTMLDVLRQDEQAPLTPVPHLADLPSLVDSSARAGLAVELGMVGDINAVPAAVSTAAYRIVQEALTNVARHAVTDRAHVRVAVDDHALTVEVTDDGVGVRRPSPTAGSGRGLAGIRERAANTGGTVEAGARSGGGFRVRARWPIQTEALTGSAS